jgi:hypothetical protein
MTTGLKMTVGFFLGTLLHHRQNISPFTRGKYKGGREKATHVAIKIRLLASLFHSGE